MLYIPPALAHPLLFNSIVLLASLGIIAFSGYYFVGALTSYARKLGMSNYFIGMVVVAVATSSPDIATSIVGLLAGKPEIMSGVVLGGLALDLAFLNGWFAMFNKKIKLETDAIKGHEYSILGLLLLPFILMLDGEITRTEGLAMVLSFFIYLMLIWHHEQESGKLKKWVPVKSLWQDALVFLFALAAMLLAARYAVFSAINLSATLEVPIYILSITVFAFANALPDMLAGTIAILKGEGGEIGFGESIGTTMIEVNLFTGIVAIIQPMHFNLFATLVGILALICSAAYFLTILRKGVILRSQGFVFIGIYAAYIIIEIGRYLFWG